MDFNLLPVSFIKLKKKKKKESSFFFLDSSIYYYISRYLLCVVLNSLFVEMNENN